jgi:2-polyprenyl-3-methyl-5-hydroxy-6-metoxy-1,4-benzoquinol methylase
MAVISTFVPMPDHLAGSTERVLHWEHVYEGNDTNAVSWYQSEPDLSLELIELLGVGPESSIIDVGGGASVLVDRLLAKGFTDLTVLDISQTALDAARERVGTDAPVTWLAEDLLTWQPTRTYELWHDRAVFHFLTEEAERDRYLACLASGIKPGGALIMATFAEDGPEYCSGLRVVRYSAQDLLELLGPNFRLVDVRRQLHSTPAGAVQPFTWVAARAAPEIQA